jgi:pteridine reductase
VNRGGGEGRIFEADLSQPEAPAELVDRVADDFGALHVVVNSAAIMQRTPIGEVTPEVWDRMFAINLRAPFLIAQAAARRMTDGGVIVNMADLAAFETWPGYVPHGITKAGVVQMTRALAHALAPRIRVNAIAPGVVLLPDGWDPKVADRLAATTPLKRVGSPEDVVQALLYLLRADFVTGETILVDGGRRIRK